MHLKIADYTIKIDLDRENDLESLKQITLPYMVSDITMPDFSVCVIVKSGIEEKLQKSPHSPIRLTFNTANSMTIMISSLFISHISWPERSMRVSIDTHSRHPGLLVLENLKLLVSMLCIQQGGLPCHSSAVSNDNSAIAFVGHSGSGKTTIASIMSKSWNVIDDDFNIFLPVYGKFFIHSTPFFCLSGAPVNTNILPPRPLKKIFILQKGLVTKTTAVSFQRKFMIMVGNTFAFSVNDHLGDAIIENCRRLCEAVPIANLFFRKSDEVSEKMSSFLQENYAMNYAISPDLSIRTISNEIFILQRSTSTIHSFNATGAAIWKSLEQGIPFIDIVRVLMEQFGVNREKAEEDISEFLFALENNRLITIKD